jgi:hypothetical protein
MIKILICLLFAGAVAGKTFDSAGGAPSDDGGDGGHDGIEQLDQNAEEAICTAAGPIRQGVESPQAGGQDLILLPPHVMWGLH